MLEVLGVGGTEYKAGCAQTLFCSTPVCEGQGVGDTQDLRGLLVRYRSRSPPLPCSFLFFDDRVKSRHKMKSDDTFFIRARNLERYRMLKTIRKTYGRNREKWPLKIRRAYARISAAFEECNYLGPLPGKGLSSSRRQKAV